MLYMIKLHVLKEDRSMAFDKVLFVESQMTKGAIIHMLKWTKRITSFKVIVYSDKYGTYIPGKIISDKEFFERPIRFEKIITNTKKVAEPIEEYGCFFPDFPDVKFVFSPCITSDYTYIKIHNNSIFKIDYESLKSKLLNSCGIYIRKCTNNDDYWCPGRYILHDDILSCAVIKEKAETRIHEYYFTIKDNMYNF